MSTWFTGSSFLTDPAGYSFSASLSTGADLYYRILKSLRPPRVYSDDDDSNNCKFLKVDAVGLSDMAQDQIDALEDEIFPHLTNECLEDWEELLGVTYSEEASTSDRIDAIVAKWRGGVGVSILDFRKVLAPILNPYWAMYDDFLTPGDLHFRWTVDEGNGYTSQLTSLAVFQTFNPAQCDWNETTNDCPHADMPLNDLEDEFYWTAKLDSFTGGNKTAAGIYVAENDDNVFHWVIRDDGGTKYLQCDRIEGGVYTEELYKSAASAPQILTIHRTGTTLSFCTGSPPVEAHSEELGTIRPRRVGIFVRNRTSAWADADARFDYACMHYATQYNNVEIVEHRLIDIPSGNPGAIFYAYVHRRDTDPGYYNLREAQRACDRMKLAHTMIRVCESDVFVCDSSTSLTDRDVLGY